MGYQFQPFHLLLGVALAYWVPNRRSSGPAKTHSSNNMPKHLLFACTLYIAARGAMAALSPMYETGAPRFTSPVLMLLFIMVAILFMCRTTWTWRFMQSIAFAEIALNAFFFPSSKFHGIYTDVAQTLITIVIGACCVILWSMARNPKTKVWFSSQ